MICVLPWVMIVRDIVLVMAPLVMWMGVSREDLVKPEKRVGEGDKILP